MPRRDNDTNFIVNRISYTLSDPILIGMALCVWLVLMA